MNKEHWFFTLPKPERDERIRGLLKGDKQPKRSPSNETLIRRMTSQGIQVTPKEAEEDRNSMTAEDYDDWVEQCIHDLVKGRIHAGPDGRTVEHPRDRIWRAGEESIREKKPSELFIYLKALIEQGEQLPTVTQRAIKTAQRRLDIANDYKKYLTGNQTNLQQAKKEFKIKYQRLETPISSDTIDDALEMHNLNYSAYSADSPRKGRRKKPVEK
ncbi:MAG: hypothetical protein P4L91_07590 [Burkholderiaceae bacterium]|nr:hypothetical protein [Burkholderiaceae bacterium]